MTWNPLGKDDSTLFKGLAILLVVTHNFMKQFPIPKENEFLFHPHRFAEYLRSLIDQPLDILQSSLSYFGHYGVQVFIFLSAYALTRKYHDLAGFSFPFLRRRVVAVFPAFLLAILAWLIVEGWFSADAGLRGPLNLLDTHKEGLLYKFLFFIPLQPFAPVGTWWFVPFIFQFYLIFPYLLKINAFFSWRGLVLLSASSIVLSMLVNGGIGNIMFHYTVIGHLPELCLGIYFASNDQRGIVIPRVVVLSALILFLLGNLVGPLWYLTHISALVLLLALFSRLLPGIQSLPRLKSTLGFFGAISMALFLVHGFLAEPFITWAVQTNHWLLTIVLCLLSLGLSVMVAVIVNRLDQRLKSRSRKGLRAGQRG